MPIYEANGKRYNLPDDVVSEFVKDFPGARLVEEPKKEEPKVEQPQVEEAKTVQDDFSRAGVELGHVPFRGVDADAFAERLKQSREAAPSVAFGMGDKKLPFTYESPADKNAKESLGRMKMRVDAEKYIADMTGMPRSEINVEDYVDGGRYAQRLKDIEAIVEKMGVSNFSEAKEKFVSATGVVPGAGGADEVEQLKAYLTAKRIPAGERVLDLESGTDAVSYSPTEKEVLRLLPKEDMAQRRYGGYSVREIETGRAPMFAETLYNRDKADQAADELLMTAGNDVAAMIGDIRARWLADDEVIAYNIGDQELITTYDKKTGEYLDNRSIIEKGIAGLNSLIAGVGPEDWSTSPEDQMILTARDLLAEAAQMREAATGDKGLVGGISDAIGDWNPVKALDVITDAVYLKKLNNKIKNGEPLKMAEQILLDALKANIAVRDSYGKRVSGSYEVGKIVGDMIPYAVEMMLNPLSGTGKAAGKAAVKKMSKEFAESFGGKAVKRTAELLGSTLGGGAMALTSGLPKTIGGTISRMTGTPVSSDNEYGVDFVGAEDSYSTAFFKELGANTLEYASEQFGAKLASALTKPVTKYIGKAASKVVSKIPGGTRLLNGITHLVDETEMGKVLSDFMARGNYHGVTEELFEEVYNALANAATVGDTDLDEFFSPDNIVKTAAAVAIPGVAVHIVNGGANAVEIHNRRKAAKARIERAESAGVGIYGEKWWDSTARENLTSDDIETVKKEMTNILNSDLSGEQKNAMIVYAVSNMEMRTLDGLQKLVSSSASGEAAYAAYQDMVNAEAEALKRLKNTEHMDVGNLDEWLNGINLAAVPWNSEESYRAVREYAYAKRAFDNSRDAFKVTQQEMYDQSDEAIDSNSNNNMVYSTIYNGEEVFITGGNVVLNEDGTIDVNNSSESLCIKFPDGHKEPISANQLAGKITVQNAEELKTAGKEAIDARMKAEFDTAEAQAIEHEKRAKGIVFDMTDPEGTHRIEILNEGDDISDILLDGKEEQIPTDELNQWKQEAGIQTESAVADDATDNGTPTESEANVAPTGDNVAPVAPVELPNVPDFFRLGGKNYSVVSRNDDGSVDVMVDGKRETLPAGTDYSTHIPTDKKGEVQYEQMPVERTHEYFVQRVKDDEARAEMIEKRRKKAEAERKKFDKKPDPGIDPDAYDAKMTQWEADKKAAQAKVDYWNEVAKRETEITRSKMREAVEGIQPRDVVEQTAEEFIADHMPKITPESFKKETGLSNSEQSEMVGYIANKDKGGVTIEQAAEGIVENYEDELRSLGYAGDMQDVRNLIIDILSNGNPRGYAKRGYEVRVQDDIDQQRADAEAWAKGAFDMKLEELYLYEETILPRIIRDYEGFDENEYYSNLAENNGYDTTRESESIGRGSELLQGEQPVPAGGTPVVGQRNEGGAVSDDVQGGGQDGVAQEEVPVSEPVGNFEQLSSSEIPNNQSVAGLEGYSTSEILDFVKGHIFEALGEDVRIVDMRIIGSRTNGTNNADSDLDVLVEYEGEISEDSFFNAVNDEEGALYIDGIRVDINPITKDKSGSIEQWMNRNKGYSKAEGGAPGQSGVDHSLSQEEAQVLITEMEANAEVAPEIELTIENWDSLFGEDGIVETPIGEVKMGENQFTKLMRQGRDGKLGMVKPTLENPDVIIEDESKAKNGETERPSSYVFVKSFKKADGSRYYYFTSVTVSKDGKEVIVSNQEKRRYAIANLLTNGKLVWKHADNVSNASDVANGLYSSQGNLSDLAAEGTDAPQTNVGVKGTSSEGGVSSISHTAEAAPAISLESRGDVVSNSTESSASEDRNSVSNLQENAQKSGEIAENGGETSEEQRGKSKEESESAPEIQEPRSVEEMLDNGDKRITNYNSRGEVATVAIERDGKVVSVDSYDEDVLFEHTEYDGNGKAASVTRYDKQGNVVGTQVYEDGKAKTPMQKLADQVLRRAEDKQKAKKGAEKKTADGQTVQYRTSEDAEDISRLDKHRSGSGPLTDREVVMESDVYSKVLGKPRYYGQKQRNYVARQRAKMAQKATELAEKLNTPIEVRETAEGLTGKKAKAKGWYDVKSGNIVVVVSNHGSIEDIQATVLHEVVAHKGLRQMFGEHFDAFLDNVYNNVDADIRAEIDALTEKYGNTREATEEYLASLAENTYFEKVNPSLWSRIKQWFLNMLTEAGIKLDFELSDNELRYILWRSHQRLVNPGIYNPVTRITDVAVRARLGIGEYAPAVEEMSHAAEEDAVEYANKNQDIFVSNAQRAIEGIQQNKATAEQWIAMLKKNGGLKAGEDAWLGLEEWLNEKQGAVTKQEILDYIAQNRIQIEEVEYGDDSSVVNDSAFNDAFYVEEDAYGEPSVKVKDARMAIWLYNREYPFRKMSNNIAEITDEEFNELEYFGEEYFKRGIGDVKLINSTRLGYTTDGLENKREIALVVPTIESWNASDEIHFGDAGNGRAVAWVRFGETTDSEGNRVLVIDEIQSKRHQDAREKGYKNASRQELESAVDAWDEAQNRYDAYNAEMAAKYGTTIEDWPAVATDAEIERYEELYNEVIKAGDVQEQIAENFYSGVPAAPFEKNWHELAMKRMLRLAAEEGFDKVAWTTGEQQAQRYDIGAVVNRIESNDTVDYDSKLGVDLVKQVVLFTRDGNAITLRLTPEGIVRASSQYNGHHISDIVGKELGNRIMTETDLVLKEQDLRIGGEGMKGFYDKILPSFVQKYTKKWGAKVGEVTMPNLGENNTMHSVDVTPEMQESVMQGQTMFRVINEQAEEFNKSHKGGARVVNIDPSNMEAELAEEGFGTEDIQYFKERVEKGAQAFYDPERDLIYLFDPTVSKEDLKPILWHEDTHKAISDLDIDQDLLNEFYALINKDRKKSFETIAERGGYEKEEYPEECVACCIQGLSTHGRWNARALARITKATVEDADRQFEIIQPLIDYIKYGRETEENIRRESLDRADVASKMYDTESAKFEKEAEEGAGDAETTRGFGQEGETRFRTVEETTDGSIDDVPAQPLTLMERITNSLLEVSAKNKENLGLRADALRTFGRDVNRVLSLMTAQKEYDKSTVDTLVKLAKMYFKNAQLLGEVDTYTMGRVLSLINNVVGKRDVTASAAKLMDILLDAHTKALAGILDKAEKVKAKKVNAAGVEVMGRLDKYGQKRVDEYRAAKEMTPEKLEEAIYDSDNRLAELEQRVREELGLPEGDVDQAARDYTGDNDVVNVYMDERARLEGLALAREYKESIQQMQEEIKDLKRELKQAEEDYRLGNIDGKSLKEFRKSVAEAIMESKAGLIEGYHSLIYKFQENTKESSKKAKAFAQAQIDRAREIQHNANSDMEGISAATQGTHPKNYNNAVMNALRSPFPTLQGMLKKFGEKNVEGKGYLYERFISQATKAGDNEFRGKVAARVIIEGKLKDIYGKKMTIAKFMKQLREYGATVTYREGNEMKQFDLTKGQMLYIYMVNKMSDGQMKLRIMGITDDVVAELMTKLPVRAVHFADWAQNELLKDLRGKYNAVHERVFGAPMAAIENYFPIKIRKEARGEKGDVSEVGQEGKPSTVTGSIIKRTKNATAIDLSADAMQVLMEHIDDMEHWAAFAEFNRDLNVLLNYKHFQNQVKNMTSVRYGSGEEMWKNFKKTAQIVSGTYRPSDSSIDRAVQNIAKGLTRSKINFRLYTAIKQLLSAPAFWTDAGVKELAYCYANPKGSFDWAKENLPGFAERWQGRTIGNEKLLKSDSDWEVWRNKFVENATRWGMTPNAAIDALTVAQGARAVYMTKLEQFKKAGYTEQRANEKALQAAAEAYNESQQSSEGIYLSPLQVEGTVASAIFSTFKNSNFGYTRKTAQAVANIKRKMRKGYKEETIAFMTKQMIRDGLSETDAKRMAEKVYNKSKYRDVANVAMFGFGLNLLWEAGGYAIYLLLGDDDEEKEKMRKEIAFRGSLGLLNGIPFGETMISAAMAVKEGDTKYFRLPQLVAVGDIENLAQVLNYDPVRGANDIVNMFTSIGVGVTPQVLTDILVAVDDIEEFSAEELGMFAARFVNAPQSNLDRLMVDDAMENSAINAEEIMQRYAEYKKSKNAPITQFLYSDEEEQKAVERYEKRFAKLLDERLENVVEDNDAYDLFYENADVKMKSKPAKMRQKYLAGDKAKDFEKLDAKELVERVLYGSGEINETYFNLSTAEDEDAALAIKIELKKHEDIYNKGKDLWGEEWGNFKKANSKEYYLYKKLKSIEREISNEKTYMEKNPEKADKSMKYIRKKRAEAIKLINEYYNE